MRYSRTMPRFRRRLSNIATFLSLMLLVGSVAVWIWSYRKPAAGIERAAMIGRYASRTCLDVAAGGGSCFIDLEWSAHHGVPERVQWTFSDDLVTINWQHKWLGFSYHHWRFFDSHDIGVLIPCWFVSLVFAILPLLRFSRVLRPTPKGLCSACGYNLTGNISGTCPECGTKIRIDLPPSRRADQSIAT